MFSVYTAQCYLIAIMPKLFNTGKGFVYSFIIYMNLHAVQVGVDGTSLQQSPAVLHSESQ